jgi:hypothetical protein
VITVKVSIQEIDELGFSAHKLDQTGHVVLWDSQFCLKDDMLKEVLAITLSEYAQWSPSVQPSSSPAQLPFALLASMNPVP